MGMHILRNSFPSCAHIFFQNLQGWPDSSPILHYLALSSLLFTFFLHVIFSLSIQSFSSRIHRAMRTTPVKPMWMRCSTL
jgi:hypothetical protein